MGKWCLNANSFIFDRIIIKVADNQDRHKSSDEFYFGPLVSMAHLYVFWNEIWPWHIGLRWAIVALWAYLFFYFFISSIPSSFSNASSLRRWLNILKYCGLCHYNPGVLAKYWLTACRSEPAWPARYDLSCWLGRKTSTHRQNIF